ncbi:hypothetical protein AHF37_11277 [Paragonimus kellicotti]|nr:hypothetical protein AHF37_11277 [Paragonimus kellicotti]
MPRNFSPVLPGPVQWHFISIRRYTPCYVHSVIQKTTLVMLRSPSVSQQ